MAPKRVRHGGTQGPTGNRRTPHRELQSPQGILRPSRQDEDAMDVDTESTDGDPTSPIRPDQEALDAQLSSGDEDLFKNVSGDPKVGRENNGKDEALFRSIEQLKVALDGFAEGVPDIPANKQDKFFKALLIEENEDLIRYIGCLVLGGSKDTWCKLLGEKESRKAIVIGVIARALKEHVFGEYLFGGDEVVRKELMEIDISGGYHCGFDRTEKRAELVNEHPLEDGALQTQIARVHKQLLKLLTPFWHADLPLTKKNKLTEIISIAARTAELIRKAPDVVYYWPPAFKDEEFEPARMEASNLRQMIRDSPYDKKKVGGYHRAVLKDPKNTDKTEAIVRIVAFPGIVAYRKFGGKLAEAEIKAEEDAPSHHAPEVRAVRDRYNNVVTPAQGFRSRLINKSVVYLEWGQQRLLTKEAGTSAHLDAIRDGKSSSRYDENSDIVRELFSFYRDVNPL